MLDYHLILYATIKDFELKERIRRVDLAFNAFAHLASSIGHKNESTLRKMCEPRSSGNGAKLGFEDALVIMAETEDYRLLHYLKEELKRRKQSNRQQLGLFCEPLRTLEDLP
jgi:hypothetical protein